jgi:DNA-3-methyladenine glycosylase
MKKLSIEFYSRTDVLEVAADLLGKIIVTKFNGALTAARIVETEAYRAVTDRASHAYNGRRTARNEAMYGAPGISYVYICYGMHHLFNVVTNKEGVPDAVLVRAVEPLEGIDTMLQRTKKRSLDHSLTKGPGNAAKALGIFKEHSGISLLGKTLYLADDGFFLPLPTMGTSKRIGIDNAGEAAAWPWRFYVKGNKYVSGYPFK